MRWSQEVRFPPHERTFSVSAGMSEKCRVEMWAVALGRTYLLPPLSSGGALVVLPWLRFHIPLIEPDRQISRIRLVWGFLCQGGVTPIWSSFAFPSFVRPAPRAFFRPDRIFPSPSRAAAVKDGASSAPPKACPLRTRARRQAA